MKQVNNVCPFCGQIISYRSFKEKDVKWYDTSAVHSVKRQYFHYSCYMRTMNRGFVGVQAPGVLELASGLTCENLRERSP